MLATTIAEYVNAGFSGIWLNTTEPTEAEAEIGAVAKENDWEAYRWDVAQGWARAGETYGKDPGNPVVPLDIMRKIAEPPKRKLMILHNYHRFVDAAPNWMQATCNALIHGKQAGLIYIVLAPTTCIPKELEKLFVVVDHPLPTKQDLATIAEDIDKTETATDAVLSAALGLTRYEAECTFSLSLARHGKFSPEEVWEMKEGSLKKSGLLTMHRGKETLDDLGGLHNLKSYCKQALAPNHNQARPDPRGIILLGVPGTGKSAFAKALGNETTRPTLVLDVGALFGSLVGQTEERVRQALKIADAMSPCILFVDEMEKALAGSNGQGDSGVGSRLLGTLLTWLNDHTSQVFFIGTCNDIQNLPKEFVRPGRFDTIFFLDFPTKEEKQVIWDMYRKMFKPQGTPPDDYQWTGAEIRACCRTAAMLGCTLEKASRSIIPVAINAASQVSALREWASGRAISATTDQVYRHDESNAKAEAHTRRVIKKGECK